MPTVIAARSAPSQESLNQNKLPAPIPVYRIRPGSGKPTGAVVAASVAVNVGRITVRTNRPMFGDNVGDPPPVDKGTS